MSDLYLDSSFRTEQDAGNDTRTVEGEELTAQRVAVLVQRVVDDAGAIPQSPTDIARLESAIAQAVRQVDDVDTVEDVSVTNIVNEELTISVTTTFLDVQRPFSLTRADA